MIVDNLDNADLYYSLDPKIKKALLYLKNTDLLSMKAGKYEIEADNIFIIIDEYQTKSFEEKKWEIHKNHIDIQFIIKGQEQLAYLNIKDYEVEIPYNKEKDISFGKAKDPLLTTFINAKEGFFIIFTPQDAHIPAISINKPDYVKKAVVKIKVL